MKILLLPFSLPLPLPTDHFHSVIYFLKRILVNASIVSETVSLVPETPLGACAFGAREAPYSAKKKIESGAFRSLSATLQNSWKPCNQDTKTSL